MNIGGIFKIFQKFKLFFQENNVFNFFVANFHGKIEPYVVVSGNLGKVVERILCQNIQNSKSRYLEIPLLKKPKGVRTVIGYICLISENLPG